jgi:hypothetical protein
MVHRREIDGREVVFGVQGALWGNAMTWWDHDTGSVWSQPIGEAIAGPRKGQRIELLPSSLTTWASWRDAHPNTLALDAAARQGGFALEDMVVVVDFASDAAAYPIADLQRGEIANDVVAGAPIAVLVDPADGEFWRVFSRTLDDRTVTLFRQGDDVLDVETGSVWDPRLGIARTGPLAGEVLDLLPGFTAFPSDFSTFWPDGRIWG